MTKPKAATFEFFEMFTNRRELHWYVKDADGNILDAWNDALEFDEEQGKVVGSRAFTSEDELRAYLKREHPTAVDAHKFIKER